MSKAVELSSGISQLIMYGIASAVGYFAIRIALCGNYEYRWHQVRKEAEAFYGITTAAASCVRQKSGAMKYSPLDLSRAVVPARPHLEIPPPGFSRMDPLPGAGFVEIDNHRAGVSK
mmetsp:Transcript_3580/g.5569  ORF Transcript_3580/g.5569 Transcript_3580/m.5569 type:complete len:117 (-) Transcript_3580:99-449(-)